MLRVTLRNVWDHKRRLISTVLAIVLGVAFMAGTLVLTDTLDQVFDDIFDTANEGIDAHVQGAELFDSEFGGTLRDRLDASLLDDVLAVDGVRVAAGYISNFQVSVLDPDGEPLGSTAGPPTWVENWIDDADLNPYRIVDGRAPEADDEVVIDRAAMSRADLDIGDQVTIQAIDVSEPFRVVGTTTFGDADNVGGATAVATTLASAERLAGFDGQFQNIFAAADEGVSQEQLVERIRSALPEGPEVLTGEEAAEQQASEVQSGFAFFRQTLLVFAGIALFVGTFIIINTFSILVTQRTRELALLRAIGASRGQVLGSVLLEALVIGLVAAVVGLGVGIALAIGVQALLDAIGVELPTTRAVVRPATVVLAFVVGLAVTLLSAVAPALKATRIRPLAALREVATEPAKASRRRLVIGVVLIVVGLFSMSPAFGDDPSTDVLPGVGLGAVALLIGVIVVGPVLARPLARVLGSFLPRLKGTTGKLARENAMRSPRRTASTAAALMIGVALVAFITIFGASATASVEREMSRGFTGDLVIQAGGGFSVTGVSRVFTDELRALDSVDAVGAMQFAPAGLAFADDDTSETLIGGMDPAGFAQVFDVRMEEGVLTDLGPGGVVVDRRAAADRDLDIGDEVTVTGTSGQSVPLRVAAISDDLSLLNTPWVITTDDLLVVSPETPDFFMGVKVADGVAVADAAAEIEALAEDYPTVQVQDRDAFIDSVAAQITALLNVIYGLLALSIIIALIGIANTLSLSIHERTRELGLLRAVGMSRSQVRSAIRWEAVIVALIGTALGLLLGTGLAYVMAQALRSYGLGTFKVPIVSVALVVVLGAAMAVLASFRPARRAAKLDVLHAIATE